MPKIGKLSVVWVLCCLVPFASYGSGDSAESEMAGMFPDLEGWTKDGIPEIFYADNLWEYINGAADVYLRYNFQNVATLTYDKEKDQSLTIDVYRHGDAKHAFGIYSQERPEKGRFFSIGTQGYYDKGIFNFFQDCFYVKIMGFYLEEENEKPLLTSIAKDVAGRLGGEMGFPEVLSCFPKKGKVENSEKFIAKDFLGRSFLFSAFTADYQVDGEKKQVFIIEGTDEDEAEDMLKRYLKNVEEKGIDVIKEKGRYRFEDPYFSSSGPLNLKSNGKYIWGLFCSDASASDFYIDKIEENLKRNRLFE